MATTKAPTLEDLSDDEVIAIALEGVKPGKTAENYRGILTDFARTLEFGSPAEALREIGRSSHHAKAQGEKYLAALATRGLSPGTMGPRISVFKSFLTKARTKDLTLAVLDLSPPRPGAKRDVNAIEDKNWQKKILDVAAEEPKVRQGDSLENATKARARGLAIIALFHHRCLKEVEIEALNFADVDIKAMTIRVSGELLTIDAHTRNAIARWIELRGEEPGPLFLTKLGTRMTAHNISRWFAGLKDRAGLSSKVVATDLLRAAISTAEKRGASATELKELIRSRDTGRPIPRTTTLRSRSVKPVEVEIETAAPLIEPGPSQGVWKIRGETMEALTKKPHIRVIQNVYDAWKKGKRLTLKQMGDDRKAFKEVKGLDPRWGSIIDMPETEGNRGHGYGYKNKLISI